MVEEAMTDQPVSEDYFTAPDRREWMKKLLGGDSLTAGGPKGVQHAPSCAAITTPADPCDCGAEQPNTIARAWRRTDGGYKVG